MKIYETRGTITTRDDRSGEIIETISPNPGTPTTFDRSTYDLKMRSYPEDLFNGDDYNNQYGGNYVVFYINVHEKSKFLGTKNATAIAGNAITTSARTTLDGVSDEALKASGTLGLGVAIAKAPFLGTGIDKIAGAVTGTLPASVSGIAKDVLVAGTAGAAGFALLDVGLGEVRNNYKRIKEAIALHVPTDLSTRYAMSWDETDTLGTQTMLNVGEQAFTAIKNIVSAGSKVDAINELNRSGENVKLGASSIIANALRTPGPGDVISKTSGYAGNPKQELIFKRVDFRTFTFTYQFFPRSETEAESIRNILKTFKLHMHPEFKQDTSNFIYIYPSEFDIYYYVKDKENTNLHRHTSCVLTDLSVMYTPSGTFSTFENGMPTQMNVQMTFRELATLTKDMIEDGY